jgi:hypothetical protein
VYIAAYGRRILPHRSGGRAQLACYGKRVMPDITVMLVISWTGSGPNMAILASDISLDTLLL